jgi:hypothetical protein
MPHPRHGTAPQPQRRQRRTVHIDAKVLQSRLDEAVQAECLRQLAGLPRFATRSKLRADRAAGRALIRDQLLALMKAFCDAAQPAGGLPLDAQNAPANLPGLLAAGAACAELGECAPKVLDKVRAGKAVDLRIAVAVLHFLRLVLETPALTFQHMGAIESERQRTVRRLAQALNVAGHELPASVYDALHRRAEETAGYAYLMAEASVHYSGLRQETDSLGIRRLVLTRTMRYQPIRLLGFADRLAPHRAYEWYESGHVRRVRFFLQPDGPDASQQPVELPLLRRVLHDQGILRIDVDPSADPALLKLLAVSAGPAQATPLQIWEEEMVFNLADRDILVWYSPVQSLLVSFEPEVMRYLEVQVGDSPGLKRGDNCWRLDRSLMPREVIAVRMRWRELHPDHMDGLGSRGECPAGLLAG